MTDPGLLTLFLTSFLAATFLPLSSELLFAAMLSGEWDLTSLLIVASAGNILGAVVNYLLGRWGSKMVFQRWLRLSDRELQKARDRYNRYGSVSLLLAWVPIIGDPLTVVAGLMRIRFTLFLLLVGIGKVGRYYVLAISLLH